MTLVQLLTLAAALGSGLMAGVFFAFSTFIMRALARRPPREGMAAMQAINVTVLNPWFLGVFLGTALLAGGLAVAALLDLDAPGAAARLAGGALYVGGTFLVTVAGNVPLNERLARVDRDAAGAAELWTHYLRRWTLWNHVRTVAPLAATAAFVLALVAR